MVCACVLSSTLSFDSNAVVFAHAAAFQRKYSSCIATCKTQRQGGQTMQPMLADIARGMQLHRLESDHKRPCQSKIANSDAYM